jgi:hypothetical protein
MKRNVTFLTLALSVALASAALAQADLGFKRLGVAASMVNAEEMDTAFGIGVFADMGTIAPQIGLETRVDFWSKGEEAFGTEVTVRDITLGARGKYHFPVEHPTIRPFAGAGLGLHMLHAEVSILDPFTGATMSIEDSSTKLGFDLGGGIATSISPRTDLLAEVWYGIVSDYNQFSLRVGVSQKLGS